MILFSKRESSKWIWISPETRIFQLICNLKSQEYIDNEYIMNKILTSDFKYYCEKNLKKIVVNDKELSTNQILQFNEFFLGVLTDLKPKYEGLIKEFAELVLKTSKCSSSDLLYESLYDIIQKILVVSPKLRTEMIIHLIKYTHNENIEEKIKAWQTIALVSNYVFSQETFSLYLLNYIYNTNLSSDNYVIKKYSAFAFVNFLKNSNLGERSVLPVLSHIKEILKLNKLYLRIYLSYDKFVETYVELYETVEETKFRVLDSLEIPKEYVTLFGFYEVIEYNNFYEESFVEDFVRVSDILSTFEFNSEIESKQDSIKDQIISNKLNYNTEKSRLYLKIRYYHDNPNDPFLENVQNTFAITEIFRLMICNRIILDKLSIYNTLAIRLKMLYPKIGMKYVNALLNDIQKIIDIFSENSNLKVFTKQDNILKLIKENYEKDEFPTLKKKLIKLLNKNPLFKTQIFDITVQEKLSELLDMPEKMFLLLGSDRFHLNTVNMERFNVILYSSIDKIYIKDKYLVISVFVKTPLLKEKNIMEDEEMLTKYPYYFTKEKIKYFFSSLQADKIYQTIINYIKLKLNGFIEQTQIDRKIIYQDTFQIKHDIPLLNKVLKGNAPVYKVNRFYKKIVFNS